MLKCVYLLLTLEEILCERKQNSKGNLNKREIAFPLFFCNPLFLHANVAEEQTLLQHNSILKRYAKHCTYPRVSVHGENPISVCWKIRIALMNDTSPNP